MVPKKCPRHKKGLHVSYCGDAAVLEFMRTVVCKKPIRGHFTFSASAKAKRADSCAAGVANQILKGPFVEATMHVSARGHVCLV